MKIIRTIVENSRAHDFEEIFPTEKYSAHSLVFVNCESLFVHEQLPNALL